MSKGMVACLALVLAGSLAKGQNPAPATIAQAPLASAVAPAVPAVEDDTPPPGEQPSVLAPAACAEASRFWVSGEYLLWWIKDSHYPVLLTGGAPTDALPGALGMPGTRVLFGGDVDN